MIFKTVALLLPALVPSWRFFDEIAPAPRIEFCLLKTKGSKPQNWQEFRPRPEKITPFTAIKRMFYNGWWNENLFLVALAERLMQNPTDHSVHEITKRICHDIQTDMPYMQFRLVFVHRDGGDIQRHVTWVSPPTEMVKK